MIEAAFTLCGTHVLFQSGFSLRTRLEEDVSPAERANATELMNSFPLIFRRNKTVSALFLATALPTLCASAQSAAPLTLSGALNGALAANPTARASQQELALATAQLASARAAAGFSITLDSSVGLSNANVIQGPPSRENFNTLTNTLTAPLNFGPFGRRAKLSVSQAQQELLAAQARFEAARLNLAGQVNAAYYNLLRQQALLAIARESEAQAVRQYQDAGKRYKLGEVPELDVIRARVPVANARAAEAGALNALAIARQTLNVLVGQPLDAPVNVEDVPLAATELPFTLEEARSRAVEFSPAVRAADATVRANELALQIAKHSRDPVLAPGDSSTPWRGRCATGSASTTTDVRGCSPRWRR